MSAIISASTGFAELPFGAGKRWANTNDYGSKALLSGWQVNGVLVTYTGEPFSLTAADTSLNTPGSKRRPPIRFSWT